MAESNFISLGEDPKRVNFSGTKMIKDEFLHAFFETYKKNERDDAFIRALTLGAYAIKEERIAAFLGRAESDLDARLEELKVLVKVRLLKERTPMKGVVAEQEIMSELVELVETRGWNDSVQHTGTTRGKLNGRYVGDIVVTVNGSSAKIVIESKMRDDKALGEPTTRVANPGKTAFGQNLLGLINRDAEFAIIVFDRGNVHKSISGSTEGILFQPEVPGLVAIVDRDKGDWGNLRVAYEIARSLALLRSSGSYEPERILTVTKRLIRCINDVKSIETQLTKIIGSSQTIAKSAEGIRELLNEAVAEAERGKNVLERLSRSEEIPDEDWGEFYLGPNSQA